jgi:1-deoxy-D-xylulose-5-phosphate reductoisomerase
MIHYISPLPLSNPLPFPRSVAVLGSTGSIGTSALKVIAGYPDFFSVYALAGGRNMELLAGQVRLWRPDQVGVADEEAARRLDALLQGCLPELHIGQAGYAKIASLPGVDMALSAQVGAAGLRATVAAAQAGKVICLANKESLVLAGDLIRKVCSQTGAVILPVDSEHHAIFQCLVGRSPETVKKLLLTASGGPFRGYAPEQLRNVSPAQALKHPNWNMGAKITIDSATMMNKGLEVIEAHHLYGVQLDMVEVLVHPESIIHSLVEFTDASMLAHLGLPDMRTAIAGCLAWPRCVDAGVEPLDLARIGELKFEKPDPEAFPCLTLAYQALAAGGGATVVLNAANEVAVELFLAGKLPFTGIAELVAHALQIGRAHV